MYKWTLEEIKLPLKFDWKISRSSDFEKRNFIVRVKNSEYTGEGELAISKRYNESEDQIKNSFKEFVDNFPQRIKETTEITDFMLSREMPSSLRFAVESAFVHYLSELSGKSVPEILGVNAVYQVKTSFSIPIIEDLSKIGPFIKKYNLSRFTSLKVKVNSSEAAVDTIKEVNRHYSGNLRIDANEAFRDLDEVMKFLEKLGENLPIEFLEQPMPSSLHEDYKKLKDESSVDIFADESIIDGDITDYYKEHFHGVNIKLIKSGGYFKAIKQLRDAKALGLKSMLGCMVETSLGISSAMNIAYGVDYLDLDGFLLLKEDPFKKVVEENGKLYFSHMQ